MITIRPSQARGHASHGWLESYHTFSFADYHDPQWMSYRSLRVINEDWVSPQTGFGKHPHRDMEIITYIVSGSLAHEDSMGNGRTISAGEFQYMAAGTGVLHSEQNPSTIEPVHLLQIWILPDARGVAPRYAEKSCKDLGSGELVLVASKTGRAASMAIHQDADLWLGKLAPGGVLRHALGAERHAWVQAVQGTLTLNGQTLATGDAAAISAEPELAFTGGSEPAQVLLFDLI